MGDELRVVDSRIVHDGHRNPVYTLTCNSMLTRSTARSAAWCASTVYHLTVNRRYVSQALPYGYNLLDLCVSPRRAFRCSTRRVKVHSQHSYDNDIISS